MVLGPLFIILSRAPQKSGTALFSARDRMVNASKQQAWKG
jgi:hypothetical protein